MSTENTKETKPAAGKAKGLTDLRLCKIKKHKLTIEGCGRMAAGSLQKIPADLAEKNEKAGYLEIVGAA